MGSPETSSQTALTEINKRIQEQVRAIIDSVAFMRQVEWNDFSETAHSAALDAAQNEWQLCLSFPSTLQETTHFLAESTDTLTLLAQELVVLYLTKCCIQDVEFQSLDQPPWILPTPKSSKTLKQ